MFFSRLGEPQRVKAGAVAASKTNHGTFRAVNAVNALAEAWNGQWLAIAQACRSRRIQLCPWQTDEELRQRAYALPPLGRAHCAQLLKAGRLVDSKAPRCRAPQRGKMCSAAERGADVLRKRA